MDPNPPIVSPLPVSESANKLFCEACAGVCCMLEVARGSRHHGRGSKEIDDKVAI